MTHQDPLLYAILATVSAAILLLCLWMVAICWKHYRSSRNRSLAVPPGRHIDDVTLSLPRRINVENAAISIYTLNWMSTNSAGSETDLPPSYTEAVELAVRTASQQATDSITVHPPSYSLAT